MSIRNRLSQFLWTLVANIKCSQGNILLGRVTGSGPAQELIIGSGLTITGTTLSVTGGGGGTGTSENLPSTLVARNPAGGFSAGAISADAFNCGAVNINGFGIRKGNIYVNFPNSPLEGDHFPLFPSGSGTFALTPNPDGSINTLAAPLTRSAADGAPLPYRLLTSFAGANNDVVIETSGRFTSLVIVAESSPFPVEDNFNIVGEVCTVNIGSPGGGVAGTMTATEMLALIPYVFPIERMELAPGNNGSGNVVPGTYNLAPTIDHIGQFCQVGDEEPYDLYQADTLTSWRPVSIVGAPVTWNATQSVWQKLVVTGSSGSESISFVTV